MDLKDLDCWGKEEMELGLKLSCSPVKRNRRYSCSLDLFNACSCETIAGITESVGNGNNSSTVSADPAEELKEQDLISCLMKSYNSSKYNRLVSFSSDMDWTFSLGMPHSGPIPEEQRLIDMYKQTTMKGVIEIIKSTLLSSKIRILELEALYHTAAPFGGLYNISSLKNNNVDGSQPYKSCWSTATSAAPTSNPISWF